MRVLYFHQYFCTPEGNSGIRSYEMAKYLVDTGHNVTMVFAQSPRLKSPIENIPFRHGKRKGSYKGIDLIEFNIQYNNKFGMIRRALSFFHYGLRSIRLIYTEKFDLVFATSTPLTAGIPAIVMKMFFGKKPFVFEVRDLWPELPREMGVIKNKLVLWLMGVLEYQSYNKADACIALSPGIKQGIERRLKTDKPVYLVTNASDVDLFVPGKVPKNIIPGCQEDDFVAVFTGAHGFANGLDAALDAANILKERDIQNIKLVFIGDGVLKAELMSRTEKDNLKNCIFLNYVPKVELVKYLQAADVGMMLLANIPAFYFGTSPNKFFDYISMGLPVLNNYPGWLAEMITDNNLGKAIPPDDPVSFVEALIELSNSNDNLVSIGQNARNFALNQFNRKKIAGEFSYALQTTLENQIK